MGASSTPTYRVEFRRVTANGRPVLHTPASWDCKRSGRPTAENLAAYVAGIEASTAPGGCNEHLGRTVIGEAQIVRQSTDAVVSDYGVSAFTVA